VPELPEVETVKRGISPHLIGCHLRGAVVRHRQLRLPLDQNLGEKLKGRKVCGVERRAKYLLIGVEGGTLLVHLGMSGSLRLEKESDPVRKHDHVDILLPRGKVLRYHDPRRFGLVRWLTTAPGKHRLLRHLGPEPLEKEFSADTLFSASRKRKAAVKSFVMDSKVVVGVGNIYASEALFRAGIRPTTPAGKVSKPRYETLTTQIKEVLQESIERGGTTLRDFRGAGGELGYFVQSLDVYGRTGEGCRCCGATIKTANIAQRSTFWCPRCQR